MAGLIDLTETSSDEEDAPRRRPSSSIASALHVNGAAKKALGSEGTNGDIKGGSVVDRNGGGGPSTSEKPQVQNGRSAAVWKGMRMGRNEASPMEEVSTSAGFTGWGDPLPLERASHSTSHSISHSPRDGDNAGENGMAGAGAPIRVPTTLAFVDVVKSEVLCDYEMKERMSGPVDMGLPSTSPPVSTGTAAEAPADGGGVCRQFWRAGDYEAQPMGVKSVRGAMDHVRVHPKFLHSNATSHKWALGAVAELLDNAVDEVHNGATFVIVDKIMNPRDSTPALLVQDDGGGMTPDTMRACMSLGYSRKNTNTTIGQYGNGFKTSTMRLGADVVVFSRRSQGSDVTQSIGLLSYTFLRKTGREDVVVPMVDYELTMSSVQNADLPKKLIRSNEEDWMSNLSSIMQWSPYASEAELLKQFDDMGWHGTKVVVYNLWFNDDGVLEMDFDSDEHDIQLRGGAKQDKARPVHTQLAQQHIANRYHHSLRVYTSILYLNMPPGFQIILRGKAVEHHSISSDLKFPEHIVYKPQIGDDKNSTASVVTVIGFTKEAPLINVHGFNVYHKNRLIIPFWKVWQENSSRGRGVVGVLEANFVEPAHDKQDFERTAVLLRLETRLKQMTVEYWNLHCHLIGYQPNTKAGKAARKQTAAATPAIEYPAPIASLTPGDGQPRPLSSDKADSMAPGGSRSTTGNSQGSQVKAEPMEFVDNPLKRSRTAEALEKLKRQRAAPRAQANAGVAREAGGNTETALVEQQAENDAMIIDLIQENDQLRSRVVDYEHDVKILSSKVIKLEKELLDSKMKNVNLQEQLQKSANQSSNKHRFESLKVEE